MLDYQHFMEIAIKEAQTSLKTGNKGFGAVIIKDNRVIARSHDTEVIEIDPIAHAEINVIRLAARKMTSKSLSGFTLLSTHEPCPMCFVACIWAEISAVVYGASIKETIKLGRKRILITSEELTKKAPYKIEVIGGILRERCLELYK